MKQLAVFALAAGSVVAADFTTGQAARAVIGQPTFTSQLPTSSDVVLGAVSGLAYANGMLFVADANRIGTAPNNHRVVVYRNLQQYLPSPDAEVPQGARCPLCTGKADAVLGQPDFSRTCINGAAPDPDPAKGCPFSVDATASSMRLPTAVATDGTRVVVADTDNNRLLIWNRVPDTNNQPADLVLGQPDFKTSAVVKPPTASSVRGPQGVWIQDNKLFVADTQNDRVLIWDPFPTRNNEPAKFVLGQTGFNVLTQDDLALKPFDPKADNLLNPVSVTSDGTRLYVSDLGHNRVLIWNSIPDRNTAPADIALGQPNLTTAIANNSGKDGLCPVFEKDADGNDVYPARCASTLEFPRFALSDGHKLFVADGGNDRVLIYNSIPIASGAPADVVLGQINERLVQTSDTPDNPDVERRSSSDSIRTPMSLAWDGTNLYVSEPSSRRVLVFSMGNTLLPMTSVRNAASLDVFALGAVNFSGEVKENDEVTLKIRDKEYKHKIKKDETFKTLIDALVALVNAGEGDPWVIATPNYDLLSVILTSRLGGSAGNDTAVSATVSTGAVLVATASGASLSGGQDAAKIAPGTLVSISGENLAETSAVAPADVDPLPTELAGVQVYIDGRLAPLVSVSPNQVNAQLPFEVLDSTSTSAYVRTRRSDGTVSVTTAVGVPIIPSNPGIFAYPGTDPRPGVVFHASSQATGTVYIEGTAKAGDKISIKIGPEGDQRTYTYTLVEGDTLEKVRDELVKLISEGDNTVEAVASAQHRYVRLRARTAGPEGNGIPYTASSEGGNIVTGGTSSALCCANAAGSLVTEANPAVPGETLILLATGLGMVGPDEAKFAVWSGFQYKGPQQNTPGETVSSLAGAKTANVLSAGLKPGTVGIYEVLIELNTDIPTNPATQVTIAQSFYVSNVVTFPVVNPNPPAAP